MARRLLLALAVILAAAVPARAEWRFAIPDGWTDLSPGKPVPEGVPEQFLEAIPNVTFHTYAVDLRHPKPGSFARNLNAIIQERPVVGDQTSLDEWVASIPAQIEHEVPGGTGKVLERAIVPIGGVPALRVVVDVDSPEVKMRSLQYMIPGGASTAQLTYSAAPEDFDGAVPVFDAAARATVGAAQAPVAAQIGRKLLATGVSAEDWQRIFGFTGKMIGMGVALLITIYFSRRSKRRKAAAGQA